MSTRIVCAAVGMTAMFCWASQGQVVPKHRDLLVGISSGSFGSIYVIDSESGAIRGLFSGLGPTSSWPPPSRGDGPGLGRTFVQVVTTRSGRILASSASPSLPVIELNPLTGDRSPLSVTVSGNPHGATVLTQIDQRTFLLGASTPSSSVAPQPDLLRVDLGSSSWTRIFGGLVGDGPVIQYINAAAIVDRGHAYLSEYSISGDTALYRVDLQTGRREIVSLLGRTPAVRTIIAGGVLQPSTTAFGPDGFGVGPAGNSTAYPVTVFEGRILTSVGSQPTPSTYAGGVIEVDASNGNRSLLIGRALLNGQVVSAPAAPGLPSEIQNVSAMMRAPSGELLLAIGFSTSQLIAWDPSTSTGRLLTDFSSQFSPQTLPNLRIRSIAGFTNCPADVNLDGIADDSDFSPFAVAYSIGDCVDAAMPLPCPSDLNGDGVVDDADFTIFLSGYDRLLCD